MSTYIVQMPKLRTEKYWMQSKRYESKQYVHKNINKLHVVSKKNIYIIFKNP